MLCDAIREDEICEAYLLYASLHGMNTDPEHVSARIASYLNNVPDSLVDEAILAFAEDRIVAPPDVVLPAWGKSRVYELVRTPQLTWLHHVCDSWFENNCQFCNDQRDSSLCHFWTDFAWTIPWTVLSQDLVVGSRLRLQLDGKRVRVVHRRQGEVGLLADQVAVEIAARSSMGWRYLALIDNPALEGPARCRILVILAASTLPSSAVIEYAMAAFEAKRSKC